MVTAERTRYRPTGGGVAYGLVAGLILAGAVYTQNNLLFWGFGLMLGGLAASAFLAWFTLGGLRLQRILPDHAVVGEPLVLRYHLVNARSWLPAFNLVIREEWGRGGNGWRHAGPLAEKPARLGGLPHGWVLHLGPRHVIQAEALCWPRRRGWLRFERVSVSSTFPFGVLKRQVEFREDGQVLIYPRLYRVQRTLWHRLALADPAGHLQTDRAGGAEEFFGLRLYRPGDSLRTIDWKHTAKAGELICREWTRPSPPRIVLALDLRAPQTAADSLPPGPSEVAGAAGGEPPQAPAAPSVDVVREQALSLAASIVCAAHAQGYQIGLVTLGVGGPFFRPHHSLPHRTRLLESLAFLDLDAPPGGRTPALEPTVVISSGAALPPGWRRCLVLDARHPQRYVLEADGGAGRLLARPAPPGSRRRRLRPAGARDA